MSNYKQAKEHLQAALGFANDCLAELYRARSRVKASDSEFWSLVPAAQDRCEGLKRAILEAENHTHMKHAVCLLAEDVEPIGVLADSLTTESRVDKAARRVKLNCPICPPNKGENSKRKPKHGVKKPKGKKAVRK